MKVYKLIADSVALTLIERYDVMSLSLIQLGQCNGKSGLYVVSNNRTPPNPDWYNDVTTYPNTSNVVIEFYESETIESTYMSPVNIIVPISDGIESVYSGHRLDYSGKVLYRIGLYGYVSLQGNTTNVVETSHDVTDVNDVTA